METKGNEHLPDYLDDKTPFLTLVKWKLENIWHSLNNVKWFFQKVFRTYHASDSDLWGLYEHLAPIILKKLKAFRSYPLSGYPTDFSEYAENEWKSKDEYDKAKADGQFVGGGMEAWLATLDEMIFAFEFIIMHDHWNEKKRQKFFDKYGLKDPDAMIPENKHVSYIYRTSDGTTTFLNRGPEKEKDKTYLGENVFYYNMDLEQQYWDRVQKGLHLFAKYFLGLWD